MANTFLKLFSLFFLHRLLGSDIRLPNARQSDHGANAHAISSHQAIAGRGGRHEAWRLQGLRPGGSGLSEDGDQVSRLGCRAAETRRNHRESLEALLKRFTETTKWRDPWFRKLSREAKLLWSWLDDNCDAAGVIDLDLACASFDIGGEITEKHLSELGDRIDVLPSGKYFIPKFIAFQYGRLSTDCRAHDKIFDSIEKHDLSGLLNGVAKPIKKVAAQEQDYHKDSKIALHLLNELSGKHFRDVDSNLGVISARLYEPGVDLAGVRQMLERQCRRWNGTDQAEYLRPETLFGKTKFDGYYAARSQPIETRSSKQTSQKFIEPDPHHIIDQVPSI